MTVLSIPAKLSAFKVGIATLSVLASFSFAGNAFADTCFDVAGTVSTTNVSELVQQGTIALELSPVGSNATPFHETGTLQGTITGVEDFGVVVLSHTASFSKGGSFITIGDRAQILGVRAFDGSDPCSYYVLETITQIAQGAKFFNDTTETEIVANGHISSCPGENANYFELSGSLCKD